MYEDLLILVGTRFAWLLGIVALDLIFGMLAAWKIGEFQWSKAANILIDTAIKIAAWLGLEAIDLLPEEIKVLGGLEGVLGVGAYALLVASTLASLLGHIQTLGALPAMPKLGLPNSKGIAKK